MSTKSQKLGVDLVIGEAAIAVLRDELAASRAEVQRLTESVEAARAELAAEKVAHEKSIAEGTRLLGEMRDELRKTDARAGKAEATLAALTTEAQALPSVESIQGCVCGCSSVPPESVQHRDLIFARRAQLERAGMRKVVLDGHGCPPEHRDAEGRFVDGVYVVCAKCFDSIAAEPASLLGEVTKLLKRAWMKSRPGVTVSVGQDLTADLRDALALLGVEVTP